MQALTAYSTLALAIVAVFALWAARGQIDEALPKQTRALQSIADSLKKIEPPPIRANN